MTADKIQALAVTTTKIASAAVTTAKIADAAVTSSKIADGVVTSEKVDSSVWSTGDVKLTFKTVADTGWIIAGTNITIGNTGSGATHAGADYEALYLLLWANVSDTYAPVTTGRGATAAADWAALKPLNTGWFGSHAIGIAGSGGALTTRALGSRIDTGETTTLVTPNLPAYTPSGTVSTSTSGTVPVQGNASGTSVPDKVYYGKNDTAATTIPITATSTSTFTGVAQGGTSTAFTNLGPTVYLNAMVKL